MALADSVIGAGLRDAKVRIAAGTVFDIFGVVTVEGSPANTATVVKGDDTILATFISSQTESLKITANAVSFDVIQAITGNTNSDSSSGGEIPIGTVAEQNPVFIEIQAYTTAKNSNGTAETIEKIWHKVQINSCQVSQGNEKEFTMELDGTAYQTALDITAVALNPARIATLKHFAS